MGAGGRRNARAVSIVALAVAVAGCWWAQPGYDSHRTGFNPHAHAITSANAATLAVDLTVPGLRALEIVESRSGYLHVVGDAVTTVDPATGEVVWTADFVSDHSGLTPGIAIGDVLYVLTYRASLEPHGCLARFDIATGADLGCLAFGAPEPSAVSGSVYLEAVAAGPWIAVTMSFSYSAPGGHAARLSVAHTTDPARSWSREISTATHDEIGNPVIVGDEVLAVVSGGVAPSRLHRWPLACSDACEPSATVTLASTWGHLIGASGDGARLAVTSDELVEVVDLASNTIDWSAPLGEVVHFPSSRPTWTPTSLVVQSFTSSGDTLVRRFPADGCGASSCEPTWTAMLDGFSGGQVAAAADVFVVSTSEEPLVVLPEQCTDPCDPVFAMAGESFFGAPMIAGGRIYVAAEFDGIGEPWEAELIALAPGG